MKAHHLYNNRGAYGKDGERFFNDSGQVIGVYDEAEKTFRKVVDGRKHRLRIFGGAWALDRMAAEDLAAKGCRFLELFDRHERRTWTIPLDVFKNHSRLIDFKQGEQLACPTKFWTVEDIGGVRQLSLL